ncbi:unnamed protein product [Adineta steineri]|uniref:G-protein coupled receptors family 1 profile domain-containing protein n=1 Tax=Adineta steineri TaxID=433720 RepID=A0A818MP50_9BILA|nr:unnamed protein product [Adineta steineri]CAF3592732.1 unnamed protein product [Adineta steineri]
MSLPAVVTFWLYLIFLIPSILFCIFCLYYFLMDGQLRQGLHNHVFILILFFTLFYELTDIIWFIYYSHTGIVLSSTPIFCLIWIYIDYSGFVTILFLMSWATIERHILIFHQNFIATSIKRFLLHYLPLIVFSIYPFLFYFIVFFVMPCDVPFNYNKQRCAHGFCLFNNALVGTWDAIADYIIPTFIIIILSIVLIIRVWYSKYRVGQRIQWRNYKKMTIQLISISFLYLILYLPFMVLNTAYTAGLSTDIAFDFFGITADLSYLIILFIPFICAFSSPELRKKIKKITRICRRSRRVVGPKTLPMYHLRSDRVVRRTSVIH